MMSTQLTITREQLITAAQEAIRSGEMHATKVLDPGLYAELMEVAHTAERICGTWRVDGCGCLVGTYLMRRGLRPRPVNPLLFGIGIRFPVALHKAVKNEWLLTDIFEVVD